MYEIVLQDSSFVRIFRKKASQELINHFTKVKIGALLALALLGCFKGGSGEVEGRDNRSSGEIRHSPTQKRMPEYPIHFLQ